MNYLNISILSGLLAVFYGLFQSLLILRLPRGDRAMNAISDAIREGANAYMRRQSKVMLIIALIIFGLIFLMLGQLSALAFLIGATFSAVSGFIGMSIAVRTNVRCTQAAKKGLGEALAVGFRGGSVTGMMVAGLALLAVSVTYLLITLAPTIPGLPTNLTPLVALGFGGSLISVFARLGGGIYTKGADVGTDMVGKIEKGIPEDDPRNPGVIADLVGDNVGDDAGMAADLFETYVVTTVASMLLGQLVLPNFTSVLVYPLLVGSASIVSSIIGTFFVRAGHDKKIMPAFYRGLVASSILSSLLFYLLTNLLMKNNPLFSTTNLYLTTLIGIAVTFGMVVITEFFTSKNFKSVQNIAQASTTGHGTNIIAGLAVSMKATLPPILLISLATLVAYQLAGLYGIAIASSAMLSLTGIIVAIDAFGPITDNAGGIAEMTNQNQKVRRVTDALDAVGNTTKAVTKAYAIASAGLAALVLFASFSEELAHKAMELTFSLANPNVLIGLFIGASLSYIFAALAMEAVGKTAEAVVIEVRRQFREIKGIIKGTAKPDYGKTVDIVTQAALRQMVRPALLPLITPILVGIFLGAEALGGFLVGTIISGLFLGIAMTTGGAAWDNAKKYIEEGNLGGKGSFAHQAAVTGDTVGDPYKDTAGPAINPMIKVANIVALLMASFLK